MRRTLILFLGVVLFTAAAGFGVARWLRCRECALPATPRVHDAAWLIRELGLNAEQTATVQALEKEFHAALMRACERHCTARAELSTTLGTAAVDKPKAEACIERMCAAEALAEQATLDHILKVRAALTPAQQAKYTVAIQTQMSGSCPMRVHRP